jgi:hypothetical protein
MCIQSESERERPAPVAGRRTHGQSHGHGQLDKYQYQYQYDDPLHPAFSRPSGPDPMVEQRMAEIISLISSAQQPTTRPIADIFPYAISPCNSHVC